MYLLLCLHWSSTVLFMQCLLYTSYHHASKCTWWPHMTLEWNLHYKTTRQHSLQYFKIGNWNRPQGRQFHYEACWITVLIENWVRKENNQCISEVCCISLLWRIDLPPKHLQCNDEACCITALMRVEIIKQTVIAIMMPIVKLSYYKFKSAER